MTYVASGHPNSGVVLPRLWAANRDLVLRAMQALYLKDASNVARVLEVCQVGVGGVCMSEAELLQGAEGVAACCLLPAH